MLLEGERGREEGMEGERKVELLHRSTKAMQNALEQTSGETVVKNFVTKSLS